MSARRNDPTATHSGPPRIPVLAPGLIHPGPRATHTLLHILSSISTTVRPSAGESDNPAPDRTNGETAAYLQRVRSLRSFERQLARGQEKGRRPPAAVLYMHRGTAPSAWVESLEEYVFDGGGLLALHSAAASFKNNATYGELLGGVFTGHGPVETFTVEPGGTAATAGTGGTGGTWPFGQRFSVRDELYELKVTTDVTVHLQAVRDRGSDKQPQDGKNLPVCWTRHFSRGRVAYLSLGHTAEALAAPEVARIIDHLFRWIQDGSRST